MNEATLEAVYQWVKKAESDWETVIILSSSRRIVPEIRSAFIASST